MERELALEILYGVLYEDKYASLEMKKRLKALPINKRPFVTELVNGVLRHLYLLDYQYADIIKNKPKAQHRLILNLALYERFYLNKEAYIANEYVQMVKDERSRAFINAILRKCQELKIPDLNTDEGSAIYYSLPLWLYKMFKAQYDTDKFQFILNDLNNISKVYYRLNHKKATYKDLEGLDIEILNEDSFTSKTNLINHELFNKGYYYVQDFNSTKIIKELDLSKGDFYLDLCAAPGSKLFNALEVLDSESAIGNDLSKSRAKLIKDKAKVLGFDDVVILNEDATKIREDIIKKANKILIDAPCSGLGVLKRKPEIRYRLKGEDIDNLVKIQKDILNHVISHINPGTILVYSTCTLNTKENEKQIKDLLKNNTDLSLIDERYYFDMVGADRFYSAKLCKMK